MSAPLLIALAGPNGAGKSTFHETQLKRLGLPFLNADILAREIDLDGYAAAGTIAAIRDHLIRRGESFVMETVFSDPVGEKVAVLGRAADAGFDVTLIFVGIAGPDLSARRVSARVRSGGHDVPVHKLAARYERSLANLERAIRRLPRVVIYDNSSFDNPYRLLAEFKSGSLIRRDTGPMPDWAKRILP